MTFAGHDSTTGHISWTLIDLLQHPRQLGEVRRTGPDPARHGPLDVPTVHRLSHLDRSQRETMRLRPVAPVMIRRALRPLDVGGRTIPAGADVFVAPVASHRLPALFDAAARYNPDRYLTDPKQTAHLHGFGGGIHRCLGEHFARLLTHVVVARLLQRYDLALIDPDPAPVRTPAFKGPRSPCRIHYRRRSEVRSTA